jgi:polysaccharide export outer membrane protein
MINDGFARIALASLAAAVLAAAPGARAAGRQPAADAGFPNIGYATWTDSEPDYRLFPGDAVDITFPSAPELDRSVVVQPDGRVALPLIPPVMAANRSAPQLEDALSAAYASQLRDPAVDVSIKSALPLKVFVGGEVTKPGAYDMEGDMDAMRAIFDAGGFTVGAKRSQVVIIRRGPSGRPMMRTVDLGRALKGQARDGLVPLRRYDIVYVPKSSIAEAGVFVQQYIRDLIPGQVGFDYSIGATAIATGIP